MIKRSCQFFACFLHHIPKFSITIFISSLTHTFSSPSQVSVTSSKVLHGLFILIFTIWPPSIYLERLWVKLMKKKLFMQVINVFVAYGSEAPIESNKHTFLKILINFCLWNNFLLLCLVTYALSLVWKYKFILFLFSHLLLLSYS